MKKRLISVILAILMSISLSAVTNAEYTAKGTGEARPETRTETQAYSSFSYLATGGYSDSVIHTAIRENEDGERTDLYFEDSSDDFEYDINGVLLDGLLVDEKTEQKINDWIKAQYKITGKRGVYYEAVNGYMTVVFGVFYDKNSKERHESITSCWNLKTGEQLTKFSDLFYKDSDFMPALKKSLSNYYVGGLEFEKEPENFSVTRLTEDYFFDYFEISSERDREFQNIFTETYKLMPAWEYFDMTPLFTGEYKGNIENRLDNKTVDYYVESYDNYVTEGTYLILPYIARSRFLSDTEINRRNDELAALHKAILKSDECKNYEKIKGATKATFAFSEDGKTAIIYTPFGEFTKNGDEIKTPSTDIVMKPEIGFLGYVDFDMDGTAEKITSGKDIEIRNSKDEIIFTIPVGFTKESKKYNKVLLWSTERKDNGNVTVRVVTAHSAKTYEFIDGKADVYTDEITHGDVSKNVYTENEAVIYALGALDYGELGYASGLAKTNSDNLQKQINDLKKNSSDSYFAMMNIERGKTQIIGKSADDDTVYVNGTANKTKDLPDEIIRVKVNSAFDSDKSHSEKAVVLCFDSQKVVRNVVPVFISDKNKLIFPLGEKGVGTHFYAYGDADTYGENTIIATDENNNEYYFYRDGDKLIEYGAVRMSEDTFLTLEGAEKIIKEIEEDGAEALNFLYRGNNVINIYGQKLSEQGEYEYVNYTMTVHRYNYDNKGELWGIYGGITSKGKGRYDIAARLYYENEDVTVYPKNLPVNVSFDTPKSGKPNDKMSAIIKRDDVQFLGYFDYDMDGIPEVVTREIDTKIYSETGELICTFPAPKNDIVIWNVFKNQEGEIIGSVEGYDYIIKNGEPKPYSGDGPENVLWMENIVYYTLGATDYDDQDYASGKAKTEVYKLLSQAKYLEPEGWGNGYFAMLNTQHGKTQIIGISSSEYGFFINGNLVPFDFGGRIEFYIAPEFDSDPARAEDSIVFLSRNYGGNTIHPDIPVFITDDDNIALPLGEKYIGNSFCLENGFISLSSITQNFHPSGEYPKNWASHAYTYEKYWLFPKVSGFNLFPILT